MPHEDTPTTPDSAAGALHLLLVEDSRGDARLVAEMLGEVDAHGFLLEHVETLGQALERVGRPGLDAVILDLGLPDSVGLDTITRLRAAAPDQPIVVLTGHADGNLAVGAMQAKAQEYLVKDEISGATLARSIRQAIERQRSRAELTVLASALAASAARFRELVTESADGVLVVAAGGEVLFANPASCELLSRRLEDLVGSRLELPLKEGGRAELELAGERVAEARMVEIEWEAAPAFLVSLWDITPHKEAEVALKQQNDRLRVTNTQLQRLAYVDPLTELLNRRGLERVLTGELSRSRRHASQLMACLVDCDDFKHINDERGHAAGDAVLQEVAARLRQCLRPSDHLARIGGDEFLVFLPDTRVAEAMNVAERLRTAVGGEPLELASGPVALTVSVGVAPVDLEQPTIEVVLDSVEGALRASKRTGKNRTTQGGEPRGEAEDLGGPLAALLAEGGLRAVFHPLVRLSDGSVEGYEILSRGPKGELEQPEAFFRLSSEADLLLTVDLRCLRNCLDAAARMAPRAEARFHVNLFPSTLLATPLDRILRLFSGADVTARFCLELSEQQFVGEALALREHVRALRDAGLSVAIDDAGFGRNAMETLILLEPDLVKIAPGFVQGCAADHFKETCLRRLVNVARALGCEVVAEGVEIPEDLELLRALGVTYGQGYLWGRPAELERVAAAG